MLAMFPDSVNRNVDHVFMRKEIICFLRYAFENGLINLDMHLMSAFEVLNKT